jgi:hypothetical protein
LGYGLKARKSAIKIVIANAIRKNKKNVDK